MLKKKIQDELNKQMVREIYSAYLYLSMAGYFDFLNLKGFSNWMKVQAQEEMVHAMKFYDYIAQKGRVTLGAIDAPPDEWKSPVDVFDNVLKHERKVTAFINKLVDIAIAEKDHATNNFLQWYVNEQVEEEASAEEVLQKVRLAGKENSTLFMMDADLARRVFTPPAATTE